MIHLFHGKDTFRSRRALDAIRAEMAEPGDMLGGNTTTLDGATVTPEELMAHATAMPFLAAHRLVIVSGLLARLSEAKAGRRKKKDDPDDPLAPWRAVASPLSDSATMPATTTMVLIEGELRKTNPGFTIFAPIAHTQEFAPLQGADLERWLAGEAKAKKIRISAGAIHALSGLAGADLWMLDNELDKLAAYAGDQPIDERMVSDVVSAARETKIWSLTDAVVAGDQRKALAAFEQLIADGQPPPLIASMIVRQYRQLVLTKDLRERKTPAEEISRATGVPAFKVEAIAALASRHTWAQLRAIYARLLDADLSVKRGLQDDESALQLLIHDLCAQAPQGASRRAAVG